MGAIFENLTEEELCDLMCGGPEDEWEEDEVIDSQIKQEDKIDINEQFKK